MKPSDVFMKIKKNLLVDELDLKNIKHREMKRLTCLPAIKSPRRLKLN